MRGTGLKLLSVACALIMVLTAFQVVTANVSADPLNETAESDPSMHDHRRLTVSNQGAVSPASETSSNGTLHVAWVDIVPNGMQLDHKRSEDNGTIFSSDLTISPIFHSISNISISCSGTLGVSITFEGIMTEGSNATIYLLYSSDGGLSWSQTYQLCEGSSPSIVLDDGYLYLGLTRPYGDSSVFSILNFTLGDNGVEGCTSMIALSIGEGYGKIVGDAAAIYYAVRCSSPYDGIIYGSIGYDGVQIDASTLMRSFYSGNVPDLDMVINQGKVLVVWSLKSETDAWIQGAVSSSDRQSWTALTISSTSGSFGSVSATAHGSGFFIAWENETKAWTEISASDLSSNGAVIVDATCLSTDRVESSSPSVTTNTIDEVSCIWVEAHHQTTELFYFRDALFESLDIYDLEEYIASLDDDVFVGSTDRSDMIASIDAIIEDLDIFDDEAALNEVQALMAKVDGFTGGNAGDDIIGSSLVQMKIFDVLSALKDSLPSITAGIKISNLTATSGSHSVNITWTTTVNGTSVVMYGINSSYGSTVTGTSGTSHLVVIAGLSDDVTYQYRVISTSANDPSNIACRDSVFTTLADTPTGTVIPPNIIPLNSDSTTITWTTAENCTTVVEYGANSSYGSIATGTNGTSHSVTITGLSASSSYLFKVRSTSTMDSSEIIYSYDTDFTTSAAEITSVTTTVRNSNSVVITWTTAASSTSVVEYGTSSSYGSTATGTNGTSHSVTITGLSATTTYHFRVRSASTADPSDIDHSSDRTFTTNAAEITSVTINVRNSNSVIITWTTSQSGTSVVDYGTTSSYGSTATGSSGTSHSVTITGLSATTTYHFRARSVISSSTYCSADRTFTTNSPEISSVTIAIDSDSATITWTTSQSGTSVVDYGTTSSYGSTATGSFGRSHSVTITGLLSATTYNFRARSVISSSTYCSANTIFMIPAITISDVVVAPVSSTSVTISWTTSVSGTTVVDYGTTSSYGSSVTGASGTSHSVTLTGLSAVTYHYSVRSTSVANSSDTAHSIDSAFRSDLTIANVAATVVNSISVTITWTSSDGGISTIEYGTSSSYGSTVAGGSGASHSVTISNLISSTTYHFRVGLASSTNSSDVVYSSDRTFITDEEEIPSVTVTVSSNSVIITWHTSSSGTSVVDYGTTSSYGSTATGSSGTSHSVTITGLATAAAYHFRVRSVISSTSYYSADRTFTTPSITISNIAVTPVISITVTITWTTSSSGTSVVDYGTTSSYGGVATDSSGTSHSVTITGLSPSTTYHYRVRSTSATNSSNTAYGADATFTTNGPEISNVNFQVESTSVHIDWTTDSTSVSTVEYGVTASYGSSITDYTLTRHHSVTITGLSSADTYHFRVKSGLYLILIIIYDSYSIDRTFTIPAITISNLVVTPINSIYTKFTWTTNINGTSAIDYGPTSSYGSTATGASGTSHTMTLTDLSASTTYHYRIRSASIANSSDCACSADATFTTNAAEITKVSVTIGGSNSVTIKWTTTSSGTTVVDYGPTSSYGSTATGASGTSHTITLTGLSSASTYHFRVRSVISHSSYYSADAAFITPAITISDVIVIPVDSASLTITWISSISGTSVIEYGLNSSYGSISTGTIGTYHSVTLTGLSSAEIYHFRVRSASATNSSDIASCNDRTFRSGIAITNIVHVVGSTSVVINWTTSIGGTSVIEYGPTSAYGSIATGTSGTSHSVTISNLPSNQTYHYRVRSTSTTNSSDISYGNDSTFRTGIVISDVRCVVGTNSIIITWTTNIAGTSAVQYSIGMSYGNTTTGGSGKTHTVTLTRLPSASTYHFRVRSASTNNYSDVAYSGDNTFVTPAIAISGVVFSVSGPSLVINWTTSMSGTTIVEYGITTSYGQTYTNTILTTDHRVTINGLASATTYHFKVRSASATNSSDIASSTDRSFTTSAIQISDLHVTAVSSTSMRISWTTNFVGTTVIEYGATTSYGTTITIIGNGTSHSVTIAGLGFNTLYHYRVTSASGSNPSDVVQSSGDPTFTTPLIAISNLGFTRTNYTVSITWMTNIEGTSVIEYGTSTSYGTTFIGNNARSHFVSIGDLVPGTTYYFRVTSASTSYSSDISTSSFSFTTLPVNDAGQGDDVGSSTTSALLIVTGSFSGALFDQFDPSDFYKIYADIGQDIDIILSVPSGANYDLCLLDSSDTIVGASSNAGSATDSLKFKTTSSGYWYIQILSKSGTGSGTYVCSVDVSAGQDVYDLDVGASDDTTIAGHLPGICVLDEDDYWNNTVELTRDAGKNATFLLNLNPISYQSGVGYLITVRYYSTADTTVQVLSNGVWVDIATLPSKTAYWSHSFVLESQYIFDSLPNTLGNNVQLRFDHALTVDTINAVAYSYTTDLSSSSIVRHNPGIALTSGWSIDGGVANGSAGAALTVSVPLSTVSYELVFTYLNATDGMAVQMYTSSGWTSIGTLQRWGSSATITLEHLDYYDSDSNISGMNLRVRIGGALYNLTSITMMPSMSYTDIGVAGDNSSSGQATKLFGVSIFDGNGKWSDSMIVDGLSVRNVISTQALFYLNAPVSDQSYCIEIYYKTSNAGGVKQKVSNANVRIGTFVADGAWHTLCITTLANGYYDAKAGSLINAMFLITSSGASIASFRVYVDSDKDTLTDHRETGTLGTDSFSADTDSDNLKDNVELTTAFGTDPTDPDTDDDGLLDGNEVWSQSWSNDEFYNVTYNAEAIVDHTLPALSDVTDVTLFIGIMDESVSDIAVKIKMDATGPLMLLQESGSVSGSSLYRSYDLLEGHGYSNTTFGTTHTWHIYIEDLVNNGISGQVQYATIQVSGTTDPLDPDTDNDGILDGEEVDLGVDGWSTNPVIADSDSDGVSDHNEIQGSTLCGSPTDPTRSDTDDDGFQDNIDIDSLGDVLIKVTFTLLYLADDVNGDHTPDLFIGIRSNGIDYFTERFDATHDENSTLNLSYYFDIWDCNSTMLFKITGVAHEAGSYPFNDDIKLDIGSDGGDDKEWWYTFNTAYSSQNVTNIGSDVSLTAKFEKVVQQKTNTIVVEGVQDNQTYGMTRVGTEYRYSADDQVILFYLDCSSSYSHFVSGTNVILLPRSVALESKLNDTLFGIGSITDANPLYGATFSYSDEEGASSSSHIIAVISNSVTGVQAESILAAITHDTMEGRVGNNISVTSSQLYLMHLPKDVLSHIPMMEFVNSNTSYAPEYLSWGDIWESLANTVVSAAEFVYNGIIAIAELYLDINRALIDIGLAVVGALIALNQGIINTIVEIAETIVDAYIAFVELAIEFIKEILNSILSPIVDAIKSQSDPYCSSVYAASASVQSDIENDGAVSSDSKSALIGALNGELFQTLTTLVILFIVGMSAVKFITDIYSGMTTKVLDIMVSIIVIAIIGAMIAAVFHDVISDNFSEFIKSLYTSQGGELTDWDTISVAADFLISVFEIIGTGVIAVAGLSNLGSTSVDIVITIIAFIMSFYTTGYTSGVGTIIFDLLAMVMSGCAFIKIFYDRVSIKNQINNNLIKNEDQTLILTFALVISGIAALKSGADVVLDVRDYASE